MYFKSGPCIHASVATTAAAISVSYIHARIRSNSVLAEPTRDSDGMPEVGLSAAGGPPAPTSPLKLLQVHVLFRHGDRSPVGVGIPSPEESAMWHSRVQPRPAGMPEGDLHRGLEFPFGQLTRKGAEQAIILGTELSKRYSEPLGLSSSNPNHALQVRSTSFPRTWMSAYYVLQGLLGSEGAAANVPIAVRSVEEENLYNNHHCIRGQALWSATWKRLARHREWDPVWRESIQSTKGALVEFFGLSPDQKFPVLQIVDSLDCRVHHNDPLPPGITPEAVSAMRNTLVGDQIEVFMARASSQLAMGRLVSEICLKMERCGQSSSDSSPKIYLYSGHDVTLMPLAVALGIDLGAWPGYSSSISIELWSTTDGETLDGKTLNPHARFVRVLYEGQEVRLPRCPPSEGATWHDEGPWQEQGSALCAWEDFLRLAEWSRLAEDEYREGCHVPSSL